MNSNKKYYIKKCETFAITFFNGPVNKTQFAFKTPPSDQFSPKFYTNLGLLSMPRNIKVH